MQPSRHQQHNNDWPQLANSGTLPSQPHIDSGSNNYTAKHHINSLCAWQWTMCCLPQHGKRLCQHPVHGVTRVLRYCQTEFDLAPQHHSITDDVNPCLVSVSECTLHGNGWYQPGRVSTSSCIIANVWGGCVSQKLLGTTCVKQWPER